VPIPAEHILAIDLGTSSLKLALVSVRGVVADSEVEPLEISLLADGGVEQDPEHWWAAIRRGTHRMLDRGSVPVERIVGLNLSSQWSGTVPVDRAGRHLTNAIIWMDSRGADHVKAVTDGFPRLQGYGVAKLAKWIRLTGGVPGHSGKDPIAHILWIRAERPDVYRETATFLEPRDYLNLRFTGKVASSFDAITLHWVTDNRDLGRVDYNAGLLRMAQLERGKLPDLLPPASVLGPILPDVARDLGLSDRVQVVIGMPDVLAASIGSGAVRDFDAHLCIGTSSWLTCHVPYKKSDLFHNMASLPSSIPGRYLLTNEQESAGICLTWLRDNVFFHDDELAASADRLDAYRIFDKIAERAPAGSDGVIFTPWLNGERTPVDDHRVRGGFFNQSLDTTRAHLVRAVLEGVAYNSRWLLTYVERFIKRRLPEVTMIGGGARSNLWCQIHADVLGRPIRQAEEPVLANARGAAFQAAAALGYLSFDEIPEHVPIARTFEPEPDNRGIYDALYGHFTDLYRSTKHLHAKLNGASR
jgi:xylulokinase